MDVKTVKTVTKSTTELFHDECSYYIETNPLISRVNQWTGFYMIGTSVMKELRDFFSFI